MQQNITQTPMSHQSLKAISKDYLFRVDGTIGELTLHTAIGLENLLAILGDKAEKVLQKLITNKAQKVAFKPYHGLTITFYYR